MLKHLCIAITLILALACGGGGGKDSTGDNPPPPPPPTIFKKGRFEALNPKLQTIAPIKEGERLMAPIVPVLNRKQHAAMAIGTKVFVTGGIIPIGTNNYSMYHQVYDMETETFRWVDIWMPLPRHFYPSLVRLPNDQILIVGSNPYMEIADLSTDAATVKIVKNADDTWKALPIQVNERVYASLWNGKIIIFIASADNEDGKYLLMDPQDFTYEIRTSPLLARMTLSATCANHPLTNRPYLVGGELRRDTMVPNLNILTLDSNFDVVVVGALPKGKNFPGAKFITNNQLGIYAGESYDENGYPLTDEVLVFDTDNGTIREVGKLQLKSKIPTMALLQSGYMFAGGGVVENSTEITDAQQIFDHNTNTSGYTNVMLRKRGRFTITPLVDGRLLIVGGEGYGDSEAELNVDNPIAEIFNPLDAIYIKMPAIAIPLGVTYKFAVEAPKNPDGSSKALTWTASAGTIQDDGTFELPSSYANEFIEVTAREANNVAAVPARVWVRVDKQVVNVRLNSEDAGARTYSFIATVNWFEDKSVTWTTTVGTITSEGVLTLPEGTTEVTITATSVAASNWKGEYKLKIQ